MIVLRVATGIRSHFPTRWPEWIMTYGIVSYSIALSAQPDMFSVSPSFSALQEIASEWVWGVVCLVAGVLRLIALIINGTFKQFKFSPHLRALTSIICFSFWFNLTLGFALSYATFGGALSGFAMYSTAALLDLGCTYRAWLETGHVHKKG